MGPRAFPPLPRLGAGRTASYNLSVFIPSPSMGPLQDIKDVTVWRPMISYGRPVPQCAAPSQGACCRRGRHVEKEGKVGVDPPTCAGPVLGAV